jgi:murein DD-endopeptidase MepM/ murein hydrolase activator NlpD
VSVDVAAIVERARLAAKQPASANEAPGADRDELKRIAAEFESMLLVQVLKDMRRAGSWEEEGGGDSLGAESLFETLDVELASHLARVRGLGLGKQMEEAFDRLHPAPSSDRKPAPTTDVVSVVKAVAEKTAEAPAAIGQMLRPVAGAVTSAFGWRRHPITHEVKFHQGVDLRAAYGQEVQAAAAGKVVFSGDQRGYGATVVVEHADGTRTRYAHLSARLVKQGETVGAGEALGRAGKSGSATGTHLHFEVIAPNGKRVEPERWAGGRHAPLAQEPGRAAEAGRHEPAAATRRVRLQADPSGAVEAGLDGRAAGNPPVMTVARSIKGSADGAD